jgi:hypothetical protein
MNPRGVLLGGLLTACVAAAAGGDDKPAKKYDSPQAVFDAATAAAKKKEWRAFHGCLTKDSGDVLAGQIAFLGLMIRGFAELDKTGKTKEKLEPLEKIYEKHGLTREVLEKMKKDAKPSKDPKEMALAMKKLAGPIKDKAGFINEVLGLLDKVNPNKEKNPLEDAELKGVKIDGDRATGTSVTKSEGKAKEDKLTFLKEGGGWKLEMPEPKPKAGGKPEK